MTDEQLALILARLQVYLPDETDTDLLTQLIKDAGEYALAYMQRTKLPDGTLQAVGDYALIAYNRRGTEGEKARSEGGENYTFDTELKSVFSVLDRYRLVKVGGKTYEAKTDES